MPIFQYPREKGGRERMLREVAEEEQEPVGVRGVVPTSFVISGPKTVPRVDYERIFVLDDRRELLGEYVLRDDCPVEYADLERSLPVSGMRHLVAFYQGEYAFTPFRVDDLWFVILTRGIPRIEDRGSIGTLLAAARVHIVPNLAPALAQREAALKEKEREILDKELLIARREEQVRLLEAELQVLKTHIKEAEVDVHARENRLNTLREYALRMQRSFYDTTRSGEEPAGEKTDQPKGKPEVPLAPPSP